jgi:catechol 2,3-dioxygenase-like lactoylglutathione lyase family enzyme
MSKRVKFKRLAPQLVVPDVVATAEYYRNKLGFTILGYFAEPPVFAMVERDEVEIHFGKIDSGAAMQFNDTVRRGLGTECYIWVDDIDALCEELSKNGVEIVEGPVKRIYNCTEVVVRDCNGFQLVFAA